MSDGPPDIVVVAPAWPGRALLRAQLDEDGFDVVATDAWPIPRRYLGQRQQPRVLVIDLQGLDEPDRVLDEVAALLRRDRVLVVTALGTMAPDDVRKRGFHVVTRPATIGHIAAAAGALVQRTRLQGRLERRLQATKRNRS